MDDKEFKYAEFIKEKIEKAGGILKFQHITGHLSQLNPNVRNHVGVSPGELMKFLRKYNETFIVDSNGNVSLQKASFQSGSHEMHNFGPKSVFPDYLRDKDGIVIKIQPLFGFIAVKDPKTQVYFTPATFVGSEGQECSNQNTLLTDFKEMIPGKKVRLNAKRGQEDHKSTYRATRVWVPKDVEKEILVPGGFKPKTGLYEPNSLSGSGTVENVFPNYGFIVVDDDPSKKVFFHKDRVLNVKNLRDMTKIFGKMDSVEFMAVRSSKKDLKVVWEATKVWRKKNTISNQKEDDSSGIGTLDGESKKSSDRKMLKNIAGKIYPHNNGTVIKFGENDSQLAAADSCIFYVHSTKVEDICWEFCEGDSVSFDGVAIKSAPGYMALLAWVGEKPKVVLSPMLGDFGGCSDDENDCVPKSSIPPIKSAVYSRNQNLNPETNRNTRSFSAQQKEYSRGNRFSELASDDTQSSLSLDSASQVSRRNRRQGSRSRTSKTRRNSSVNKAQYCNNSQGLEDSLPKVHRSENSEWRNSSGGLRNVSNGLRKYTSKESVNSGYSDRSESNQMPFKTNKTYKNWGDSPYPDEEEFDDMSQASNLSNAYKIQDLNNKNILTPDCTDSDEEPAELKRNSVIPHSVQSDSEEEESLTVSGKNNVFEPPLQHGFCSLGDEKTDNVNDNTGLVYNCSQEVVEKPTKRSIDEYILSDESSETQSSSAEGTKPKPYIKRHRDLEGKLIKVYCKYAEIEHSLLKKHVSFFWNDLYHNGVPVNDKFDDLKEVVSVGQTVKFNSLEIVDDDGCLWQKVTMVWRGVKPKAKEMTPREYISQNELHVSVEEEEDDNIQSMRPLNAVIKPDVPPPPRKFLTVAFSSLDDEPSVPEVDTQGNGLPHLESDSVAQKPVIHPEAENASDNNMAELIEAVSSMVYSCLEAQADVDLVSANIIKLVLETNRVQVPQLSSKEASSERGAASQKVLQEKEPYSSSSHQVEMTSSLTQTIITGDVIAQSIFTL